MFSPGFDSWLDEQIDVPEPLVRALGLSARGWRAQRGIVLEQVAQALSLDPHTLGQAAYDVLDALLEPLGRLLTVSRKPPAPRSAAYDVVDALSLAGVIDALVDFGWGNVQLRQDTPVDRVEMVLRDLLVLRLTQRVSDALDDWRRRPR